MSGFKYYLVILDYHLHYLWTFPLRLKSDTYTTLTHFFAYVQTQFGVTVKAVQCDNGKEFDNSNARTFFLTHGVHLRMSCPYTSALFVPLIMLFTPFCFRLQRLLPSGWKPSPLLPTFSTCYPPKHSTLQHHTSSSSAPRRRTTTSGSLGVRATPTCPPPLPTS